jgi:hypothetical protein
MQIQLSLTWKGSQITAVAKMSARSNIPLTVTKFAVYITQGKKTSNTPR